MTAHPTDPEEPVMFDLVFSFAPWIAFTSVNRVFTFTGAVVLALVVGLAVLVRAKRRGHVHLLDAASVGYFALMLAVIGIVQPDGRDLDTWSKYVQTGSYAALALIVFGSILVRRPFTLSYAKESVPEELWTTDLFLQINNQISARWGTAFVVGAVATAIHASTDAFPFLLAAAPYVALYLAYRYTQKASSDDDATEPAAPATVTD